MAQEAEVVKVKVKVIERMDIVVWRCTTLSCHMIENCAHRSNKTFYTIYLLAGLVYLQK